MPILTSDLLRKALEFFPERFEVRFFADDFADGASAGAPSGGIWFWPNGVGIFAPTAPQLYGDREKSWAAARALKGEGYDRKHVYAYVIGRELGTSGSYLANPLCYGPPVSWDIDTGAEYVESGLYDWQVYGGGLTRWLKETLVPAARAA